MSFISVLEKVASAIMKGVAIESGVEPLIQPLLGSGNAAKDASLVQNDLNQIGSAVTFAESIFQTLNPNMTSDEKIAALTPAIVKIIQSSTLVAGHPIGDPQGFSNGCATIAQGVTMVLKSVDGSKVQTSGVSLPAPAPVAPVVVQAPVASTPAAAAPAAPVAASAAAKPAPGTDV